MNSGSERMGGFVRDLGDAARNNPISAALIGMGAVWLFASRSQRGAELIKRSGIDRLPDAARDAWAGASSNIRETADEATDTVRRHGGRAVDQMTEAGKRLVQSASESVDDLPDRAADLVDDAKDSLTQLFKSQPLAIGAMGLAIGAVIAAAFPTTETEAEYLGETSEFIKQKAGELAGEKVERIVEVGEKVADAVADEARQQGLTVDGLKSVATELSDKAGRVAEAATRSHT